MVKELNYYNIERDDVTIFSNGVVLREYNKINNGYDFKIVADVAVVNDDSNCLRVFGASDGEELWSNVNELVGFTDKAIEIVIVDANFRLPEGETVISAFITSDNTFDSWALVLYESEPVLYVIYDDFDESSYKELTLILSKLYFI